MLDPIQARYSALPLLDALEKMSPEQIGRAILPTLGAQVNFSQGFVPADFARGAAMHRANGNPHYEQLISEGLDSLDRSGMTVHKPGSGGGNWRILSRSGKAATEQTQPTASPVVTDLQARALLHPQITNAALNHLDHSKPFLDDAATAAFRVVEDRVRNMAELGTGISGKDVFYAAFAEKPPGPLIPPGMNPAEGRAIREVFAGAFGLYRNPSAHRPAQSDPAQTMRILLLASTLMYTLDEIEVQLDGLPAVTDGMEMPENRRLREIDDATFGGMR